MANSELIEVMGPACAASLMIALTHAPLGVEVLKRGIIFMDLAIAQIAGLGLVIAAVTMTSPPWWAIQFAALAAALLAAYAFRFVERIAPAQQEAVIGCSFVLAASVSLLLLANRPHGGEEVEHLLSGQVLFVTWREVGLHAPIYAAILALWFAWPQLSRSSTWFYLLFATAITSSVQLVGVYVVFASLILPALAAGAASKSLVVAWCCGILSVGLGLGGSLLLDAPAGPVIVVAYVLVALMVGVLRSWKRRISSVPIARN